MTVEVTYTDEVICYDEETNQWRWGGRSYTTLSGAKKVIDKKYATDFPRVPCLVRRWGTWYHGEITSKTADGGYWVTADKGKGTYERRLERMRELYMDIPENRENIRKADELRKQADNLHREADELIGTLTPVFFPAE